MVETERKPNVVLSAHLKGGCGKTTVLTDLAISMALQGERVVAIDTDMQGAMIATLTGMPQHRYSPSDRIGYFKDLTDGTGFKRPDTKYPLVNDNVLVGHYPLEMLYQDAFFQPEFETGFVELLREKSQGANTILVDMPPVRLVSDEVRPFQLMAPFVDEFTFLIVNRPTRKEIEDGAACFNYIRELMIKGGIDAQRIRPLLVLNFVTVFGADYNFDVVGWGSNLRVERGRHRHIIAASPFSTPNQEEIEVPVPRIQIPNIQRAGRDMNQYSVLLDSVVDLEAIMAPELDIVEATHEFAEQLSGLFQGKTLKRQTKDYKAYLSRIFQLRATIFSPVAV